MNDILDEAARLLGGLQFTTERGATARGAGVHVVVDPEWDAGGRCFRVALLCVAPAVDRPGWAAMPLLLERVQAFALPAAVPGGTGAGDAAHASGAARAPRSTSAAVPVQVVVAAPLAIAARLDQRGHATVHDVPPGEYRFSAGTSWVQARAPLALPLVLASADRRLAVSLRSQSQEQVEITVETDGTQAHTTAAKFWFFDRNDRVLLADELDLTRSGRWQGRIDLAGVGGFACQLLRGADRPGATI